MFFMYRHIISQLSLDFQCFAISTMLLFDIQLSISAILLKASAQKNDGEVGAHELAQIFQRINCRHWCW